MTLWFPTSNTHFQLLLATGHTGVHYSDADYEIKRISILKIKRLPEKMFLQNRKNDCHLAMGAFYCGKQKETIKPVFLMIVLVLIAATFEGSSNNSLIVFIVKSQDYHFEK